MRLLLVTNYNTLDARGVLRRRVRHFVESDVKAELLLVFGVRDFPQRKVESFPAGVIGHVTITIISQSIRFI
jgi:hypothetical protein